MCVCVCAYGGRSVRMSIRTAGNPRDGAGEDAARDPGATHCVALRTHSRQTGRAVREFCRYGAAEAAALRRRGIVDLLMVHDSADECEAACGTLTMLPPELRAQVLGRLPLGDLASLARTSRLVRGAVAPGLAAERGALSAIRSEFPSFERRYFGAPGTAAKLDRGRALLGVDLRPHAELLARLRCRLWVPLDACKALALCSLRVAGTLCARSRYVYYAGELAALPENAWLVERGAPAALPSVPLPLVLLSAETVCLADKTGRAVGQPMAMYTEVAHLSVDGATSGLFNVRLELLPTAPKAVGEPWTRVIVTYTLPLPPGVSRLELQSEGRALRNYLTAAEQLFGLPDGDVSSKAADGGRSYALRGGDESKARIVETLRRTGVPVSGVYAMLHTPIDR